MSILGGGGGGGAGGAGGAGGLGPPVFDNPLAVGGFKGTEGADEVLEKLPRFRELLPPKAQTDSLNL